MLKKEKHLVQQMQIDLQHEKNSLIEQFNQEIELERQNAMVEINQKFDELEAKGTRNC